MGFTQFIVHSGPSLIAGRRHWKIRLSDEQVEDMRVKREDHGWSYGRLARHFNVPRATVQGICNYRTR